MKTNILWNVIVQIAIAVAVQPAWADSTFTDTLTEESITGNSAMISAADPLGDFVVNFSTLDEEVVTVTWQAPVGQFIEIAVPTGYDSVDLDFRVSIGSIATPGNQHLPVSIVNLVEDLAADPLPAYDAANSSLWVTGPGGDRFLFTTYFSDLVPGSVHRVSSLTATATVPADFNINYNQPIEYFHIEGNAFTEHNLPSPGQWVRLVAIPEPSSSALLLLGLLGGAALLARRRHRFSRT